MSHLRLLALPALMMTLAASLDAQPMLRPEASSRATASVSLAYPRPAAAMGAMPGMTRAPAAAPPAPAPKPLVIRIDYGQPHLRGRTLHTDSLVPYDKPWRTGASASTTLTTEVDMLLGGATLTKGTYVLYTMPSRSTWKLIVQRSIGQSAMTYADSNDVVRVDLRHTALATPMESFTIWLIPQLDAGPAHGELRFAWGTDQLSTSWSVR